MLKTSLRNTGKGAWKAGLTGLLMVTSVTAFASAGQSPRQPMRVRSQSTIYPTPMKLSAILARCLMDADGVRSVP